MGEEEKLWNDIRELVEKRVRDGNSRMKTKAQGRIFWLVAAADTYIRVKRERSKLDYEDIPKSDFVDIWQDLKSPQYRSVGYLQKDLQDGQNHHSAVSFALASMVPYVEFRKVGRGWRLFLKAMSISQAPRIFVQTFAPDQWSSVRKFHYLMGPPFDVTRELVKGASTSDNHLEKFNIFVSLARQIQPRLEEDRAELDRDWYTPASRSREFAALTEALFCELYSCLDGVRRTIFSVYRNVQGIQNKSTEKMFVRAGNNRLVVQLRTLTF